MSVLANRCLFYAIGNLSHNSVAHSEGPVFLIFSSFMLISQLLHGISIEK